MKTLYTSALFVFVIAIAVVIILASPFSTYAQQQMNFRAFLTGKVMVPPVTSTATAEAGFHLNHDGSLCYYVNATNITGVLGAHIGTKNGTELADLINPYATIATQQAYPTGSVHGILTSGDIKAGITGPPGSRSPGFPMPRPRRPRSGSTSGTDWTSRRRARSFRRRARH